MKVKSFLLSEPAIITKRSIFATSIFFLSSRVRFCHFIQFNCGVALRPRFHAYIVSTGFLITRGKESLTQNDRVMYCKLMTYISSFKFVATIFYCKLYVAFY